MLFAVALVACQAPDSGSPTVSGATTTVVTSSPAPTELVLPTATLIPTATVTRPASPTAPPSPRVAGTPAPVATIPANWLRWSGTPSLPFTIAYPPDWLVDRQEPDRVYFRSPQDPDRVWLVIGSTSKVEPGANIDALRDAYYQRYFTDCRSHAIDRTNYVTYAGVIFAGAGVTCDQPNGLLYARFGFGLLDGVPWRYRLTSPYGSYSSTTCGCPAGNLETYFQPMLVSLTIGTP